MEDTLKQLAKEIVTPKFGAIKNSCNLALAILQNEEAMQTTEAWKLREICLEPLQLALESRAKKLAYHSLTGIQHIFRDERFHSSLEAGEEEKWLPVQILNTLYMTPSLPEDIQVEVMKLLLNMTLTTAWCMNARIVTKISQLYLSCHAASPRSSTGQMAATCLKESLGEWFRCQTSQVHRSETMQTLMVRLESSCAKQVQDTIDDPDMNTNGEGSVSQVYIETYRDSSQGVRAPVQAAMTQMLTNFMETLKDIEDKGVDDEDDVLADFKSTEPAGSMESSMEEVVALLQFLLDKMEGTQSSTPGKHVLLLLLEGVHAILSKVPDVIQHNALFQELIWKQLCPTLISLLGTPKMEKSALAQRTAQSKEELGRGSGCSTSAPSIMASAAKVIYSIAAELVRLVGTVGSLRPVLESLFHRMLLYPPPQHRLDALRVVKEMLGNPERLLDLCAPASDAGLAKMAIADVGLIKLILDAVQECCHCNDSAICFTSVTCMDSLLQSLESLARGQPISDALVAEIQRACSELQKERLATGNGLDMHGGSVREELKNVPAGRGSAFLELESPPDSPRPVADSDANSEASSMDMSTVKRVTVLHMRDVEGDEASEAQAALESEGLTSEAVGADDKNDFTTVSSDVAEIPVPDGQDLFSVKQPLPGTADASGDRGRDEEVQSENGENKSALDDGLADLQQQQQLQQQEAVRQQYKIMRERCEVMEQQNAAQFVQQLRSVAADLVTVLCITDVDETLQNFSSSFCDNLSKQQSTVTHCCISGETFPSVVLNADGVYTASVAALQLCYKLSRNGFYRDEQPREIPVTQTQFVDRVLSSGLLLFLSPTWLTEVYHRVLASPLVDVTSLTTFDSPLLQFLEDLDGLDSHEIGGQFLFEYRSELYSQSSGVTSSESQEKVDAGKLVAQCLLRSCWDGLLEVLSVLLNGKSSCGISFSLGLLLGMEGAKEETQRARDAICLSLNGLQTASRLSCMLGLQSRCGSAFAQLANTSCVREDLRTPAPVPAEGKGVLKAAVLRDKPKLVRLHAASVLSMDVVMTTGLEVGSHASDCWRHVFRCCGHISELEHTYFSRGNHQSSLPKVLQEHMPDVDGAVETAGPDAESVEGPFMTAAAVPVAPRINVAELIRQSSLESGWETSLSGGGVLTPGQAAKALCGLSQEVDTLFEDAARKLNLRALLSFLTELGEASRQQLHSLQLQVDGSLSDISPLVTQSGQQSQVPRLPTNALHLYRLQEVLMAVVHSPRPLLHLMQVWAAISPYLVEATGHRDRNVSKMAVTCIHDFIVAMLSGHPELPHFHVNEFLCKTFEDMLCLELCDSDVQDQIVCSICELVEACTKELQSGWRPLFGALRSVRIEFTANEEVNEARQRHVAAVLDVFEVYLNTDNVLVFSNATVDCILCLLKYVHGPGMFEDVDGDDSSDSGSDMGAADVGSENLCLPALNYLTRCCHILASMWKMPACPVFKGAFRIQLGSTLGLVDPVIPHMNVEPMPWDSSFLVDPLMKGSAANKESCSDDLIQRNDKPADSHSITSVDSGMQDGAMEGAACPHPGYVEPDGGGAPASLQLSPLSLNKLDKGSGVLHVWYLLLDGLATAIASCPSSFQPQTLTTLFELLRNTAQVPGPSFALYCVNHLLLPMLQSWLRRGSHIPGYWDKGAVNFRQCCGLTTDLVVDFISRFTGECVELHMVELMLKQLFDVLSECVAQPTEVISRLGCSCIRHVLLSSGPFLSEPMWNISAQCLARAFTISTYNVRQLMTLFQPNSDNFYGDIGQVKVATRKDCVAMDSIRLRQLAQQVFLLDSQMCNIPQLQYDLEEDKSFVFLLYPPEHHDSLNPDHISARVPLRDIVVGLLSNQLLLQTLDCILLDGAGDVKHSAAAGTGVSLPGLMRYMSTRNIMAFLCILESSYQLACEFDMRPGLKFLLQKVIGLEVAANLYRQAGASMVLYLHTLTHLCSYLDSLSVDKVQTVLADSQTPVRLPVDENAQYKEMGNGKTDSSNTVTVSTVRPIVDEKDRNSHSFVKPVDGDGTEAESGSRSKMQTTSGAGGEGNTSAISVTTSESCQAAEGKQAGVQTVPRWKSAGMISLAKPWDSADVFLPFLHQKCDEVCQQYLDILADGTDDSIVDRMANRPLFFLIAQPDDITELTKPHKTRGKNSKTKRLLLGSDKKAKDESPETDAAIMPAGTQQVLLNEPEAENQSSSEEEEKSEKKSDGSTEKADDEDSSRQCSKRQLRAEQESKVYSVATDKVIQNLIGQYKRHKQQNAMPSSFIKFARGHRPVASKVPRREPVDDAIDKQQKSSIMRDSEARRRAWSETLVMALQLFLQLPDPRFQALLPAVFGCINQLICHAQEANLRDTLAQWFQRLGHMYGFGPRTESTASPAIMLAH